MNAADLAHAIETHLEKGLHPFLIVASAGITNTGAVDPLGQIGRSHERIVSGFMLTQLTGASLSFVTKAGPARQGIAR